MILFKNSLRDVHESPYLSNHLLHGSEFRLHNHGDSDETRFLGVDDRHALHVELLGGDGPEYSG